ncbi:phage antirepressor N-terminal domain-containing protein [Pseudomonas sp. zfem003]|uniref:phage antirepressor N-terminal domain-containing protein n=1 Tax=Pseudomonas sp. zfem003 TaxID=3078198 RepID=UPI002928E221|nr:phage antirepressor N-terminal domain-containing protein [Pseudomonas sp. zfem003]MDU9395402.1 phage antirepressor N-terminal domain-containing protein [Pseudomonas sp. zfem003]
MSTAQQLIPVPFYEDTVVLVGQDDHPYVAMKTVVTNMGLDWKSQHVKLKANSERWGMVEITTPSVGGPQVSSCLPLRKLASWLMTISPNKVKPELRDKIVRYQNECDDALWDYWTKGSATRPGAQPATQRIALSRHRLALGKELLRTRDAGMRQMIHQQLDEVSRAMGLPTPPIDSIGQAAPAVPDLLAPFWAALAALDAKGVAYNHARAPDLLAVNLPELARLFLEHGQPLRLDNALRTALWHSPTPRCLHKNHPLASRLTGKTLRCWVFESPG